METVLLDRPDIKSAGAGETPIIAIAHRLGERRVRRDGAAKAFPSSAVARGLKL